MSEQETHYNVIYMAGVEGNSIYLNDTRIAGPKPWGGGQIIKEWKNAVSIDDLLHAIPELRSRLSAAVQERDEARAAAKAMQQANCHTYGEIEAHFVVMATGACRCGMIQNFGRNSARDELAKKAAAVLEEWKDGEDPKTMRHLMGQLAVALSSREAEKEG